VVVKHASILNAPNRRRADGGADTAGRQLVRIARVSIHAALKHLTRDRRDRPMRLKPRGPGLRA
jgi:hypothetical protein